MSDSHGDLCGYVAVRKLLNDAIKLPVHRVWCIYAALHATVHIARDLAEFQLQ